MNSGQKLVIIGGVPATGKTTTTEFLAKETEFQVVAWDRLKESVWDVCATRDKEMNAEIGSCMFGVFKQYIESYLKRGESVIAEATFTWESDADWINGLAQKYGVHLYQVWHTADSEVAKHRFKQRWEAGKRHPGHFADAQYIMGDFKDRFWNKAYNPLNLKGDTMVLDTTDVELINRDVILKFIFA